MTTYDTCAVGSTACTAVVSAVSIAPSSSVGSLVSAESSTSTLICSANAAVCPGGSGGGEARSGTHIHLPYKKSCAGPSGVW